jgi:phospholipid/cholesterol/gamma-HCH transport system substrate-binding protein
MENKSHAFAAGAFVLVVAALLVAMALWLTRDTSVHRMYELSTRESVTGLQPQASVRYRGVAVGKVMEIGFDKTIPGNVLIRITTDDAAPITRATFGTLGFQGVTGLAFIQLDDTGDSKEPLPTTDDKIARIPMRPGLISRLTDQGNSLLVQVEETSRRLNQLLAPDNQKALFAAVADIGQAATGIKQLSVNADRLLTAQFGPERLNLPKLAQDMTSALKSLQSTGDKVGSNVDRMGASADEVKQMASDIQAVAKSVNQPGGVMDKLNEGVQSLSGAGQTLTTTTLPRLNRATDEAARMARQVGRTADAVSDNPQSLIYGNGTAAPGPGEPGFTPPSAKP